MGIAAALSEQGYSSHPLSLDERIRYQEAIEEVYYRHRVWPDTNPRPKPPFEELIPPTILRAKVEDYLRKTNALEVLWKRPVKPEQLQAEMVRMARDTKDPEVLAELFDALGNDPRVIAECLARPSLVDRSIHDWYARDPRFHQKARAAAVRDLAGVQGVEDMRETSGTYQEIDWIRDVENLGGDRSLGSGAIRLGPVEWNEWTSRLATVLAQDSAADLCRLEQQVSPLQEDDERFWVIALIVVDADRVKVATLAWSKVLFGTWWQEAHARFATDVVVPDTWAYASPRMRAAACTLDSWAPTARSWPRARSSHTAVWTGSEMIVWGGWFILSHNTGGRYDPATDSWSPTSTAAPFVPVRRYAHVAVWTGTEMIVWGGVDSGLYLSSGGRYDPSMDSWLSTSTGVGVPTGREAATAIWTGGEMIVWGGWDGSAMHNTGGMYDPLSDSWVPTGTGSGVPTPRESHTAIWTGSEMVVWGGWNASSALDTGGRYSLATQSWLPTSTGLNVPSARVGHTAVWTGNEMIIWGGGVLADGGRYDPLTDSWTPMNAGPSAPPARSGHTATWTGTEMIVWGGYTATSYLNTGGRYLPGTDTWMATSTGANVPVGRYLHTAVWTGSEMIVWGGGRSGGVLNSGGRYDPAFDTWVPTSAGPAARALHTAVWTGVEMVVWGGWDGAFHFDEGSRYDPALDTWRRTSTGANAPSGRYVHAAVWTGTEMVIWGGSSGSQFLNTGGRYDPSIDTWAPMSLGPGVPAARVWHTAVWTGAEVVIWGGSINTGYSNTGARYDLSSDSWVPTSTSTNVPSGREYHTAIWTGNEMIVWGGDNGNELNTGGRYNPGTDAWTPTSTGANVPAARSSHTAAWTGSEMIVWGGVPTTNTGARYVPSTDTWIPTSLGPSVPAPRYSHSSIWTGSAMIVWGGEAGNPGLDTGGQYLPWTDSWQATNTGTNTPAGRRRHTSVWTGNRMIVWGGDDNVTPLDSGGLYCACPGIALTPATLPAGIVGQAYAQTISASGGTAPYTSVVAAGVIPPGLTMSPGGVLSGTPGQAGTFDFTVAVTDADGCVGGWKYSILVGCQGTITLSPPTLPDGTSGQGYVQTITASGGTAPYTFGVTAGALPAGLGLSLGGILSGTPLAVGSFSFTLTATDAAACTGSRPYVLTILPPACGAVLIAPQSVPDGVQGLAYAVTLTATGGMAPYSWAVTTGALPPGLAIGAASGIISGTPTQAGSYSFTVTATDASPSACTGSRTYVTDVAAAVNHVVGEGLGQTNGNGVRVYKRDGTGAGTSFSAYGSGQWGTNVSSGDINGAIYGEILTGPGPGEVYGPHVRGWRRDGSSLSKVSFYAYSTLKYGANVGAGRLDGDAFDEILTGPGPGEVFGPHVRAFNFDNATLAAIAKVNFFAYGSLKYGVNVEEGSVDGDGYAEILTGAGPGSVFAATVRGFNYDNTTLTAIAKINFNAFPTSFGVNVAGGDADGDGYAEIAAAEGPAPANPNAFAGFDYDAASVAAAPGFAVTPPPGSMYGGRVGTGDVSGDGRADLACGLGRDPAVPSTVNVYRYTGSALIAVPPSFTPFTAAGYAYGVNVAGGWLGYF